MLKTISRIILLLGQKMDGLARKIAYKIYTPTTTLKDLGWTKFCKANGEELRYAYDLNKNSIVFDVGGYEGEFTSDLFSRYESQFYIFEVYQPYTKQIKERFRLNDKIKVYDFGLGAIDETIQISIDTVSTSSFKKAEIMVDAKLKKASNFMDENEIKQIDLIKINIEGGEYNLLNHLIDSGKINNIINLQIQFHDFVPNAISEMESIRKKLKKTHTPTYQFDFIWENWKKNP
ncbi:FkbM family methyltransferase [Pedobacter sp. LMG 31464]|uniref:FkbM family methyltransferase n=1 Tax=Pedobacter planticolens TaxID=2679964 RepID=A0A923ISZ2_9SPHI|nr:FkbM family methyltransferase [Pedobacter planticolens]MBB2144105.1 FkbM family methyltransferase [Pedobacter planticolens]